MRKSKADTKYMLKNQIDLLTDTQVKEIDFEMKNYIACCEAYTQEMLVKKLKELLRENIIHMENDDSVYIKIIKRFDSSQQHYFCGTVSLI